MEEKRRDKRLELQGELILKKIGGENSVSRVQISIKDVSKSGIGFSCPESLTLGSVYECNLTIWTKEVIHCFIEVIRSFKNGEELSYGGIFIGMPEMDSKRIEIYTTLQDAGL